DLEKGRVDAFASERSQNPRCCRSRPVVEGEDHFLVVERKRLRKALEADTGILGCIDLENTRSTERSLARTVASPCRSGPCHKNEKRNPQYAHGAVPDQPYVIIVCTCIYVRYSLADR